MLPNRGGRPRQRPAPKSTFPELRPKPGPGQVPPLARPNQASATAFLANHNGGTTTTTSPVHRTTSQSSQRRLEPYPQPLAGFLRPTVSRPLDTSYQPGQQWPEFYIQSFASEPPQLVNTAPHPIQRLPEIYIQPHISGDILSDVPTTGMLISIVTQGGLIKARMASSDDSSQLNWIDRRTVECFDHGEEPCKAEYRWTPRASRFCSRVAVFPCMLPEQSPLLEIAHTPKQVRMHIIEEDVIPLIHFGRMFRDHMKASVFGDNVIQPWLSPDVTSHHSMRQPFQEPYVQGSQPVPDNPQSTARAFVVDVGTTEDSLANLFLLHTTVAADSQYEHWRIEDWDVEDWDVEDWDIEELMQSN